jgi:hypothetical protein
MSLLQDAITATLDRNIGNLLTHAGKPVVHIRMAFRHTAYRAIRVEARNALRLWRDGNRAVTGSQTGSDVRGRAEGFHRQERAAPADDS